MTWAWLADYDHRDVAIATYTLDFIQWRALSVAGIIIRVRANDPDDYGTAV